MRAFLISAVALLVAALSAHVARAEAILVNSSSGGIYRVEIETGAVTEITVAPQFFDIAIGPRGDIYGITGDGQVWQVDAGGAHLPLSRVRMFVNALEFDRRGALIGAGNDAVVAVSVEDGRTRVLGRYPGFASSGDMAFGPEGLYATAGSATGYGDQLVRFSDAGDMTVIGPIGFRNVYGLVWSEKLGQLIGVTEARELIVIDRWSGAGRMLHQLDFPGFGYGASGLGGNAVLSGLW